MRQVPVVGQVYVACCMPISSGYTELAMPPIEVQKSAVKTCFEARAQLARCTLCDMCMLYARRPLCGARTRTTWCEARAQLARPGGKRMPVYV